MKIAIDCRMSGKSGIGAFLDGILPYMVSAEGHAFLLLGAEQVLPESVRTAASVRLLPCGVAPFSLRELLCFPRRLSREINTCDAYFTPYCNIPSGIRIPIYSTIHDVVFLDVDGLAGRAGTLARRLLYQHAINRSRALFTVSEFSRSRIRAHLRCRKDIYIEHNGVPEYLRERPAPPPPKTCTVIFIGNIKRHKGLHVLLPAFRAFRESCIRQRLAAPELVIVGSQERFRTQDTELAALQRQGPGDGIRFTGYVTNERLRRLLTEARVLVQPSFYEGFGIPPLEALHCGTKVILSDIPVFREIYEGFPVTFFACGDAGDLAQKLEAVWKDGRPLPPVPDRYSFQKTAASILARLEADVPRRRP